MIAEYLSTMCLAGVGDGLQIPELWSRAEDVWKQILDHEGDSFLVRYNLDFAGLYAP